ERRGDRLRRDHPLDIRRIRRDVDERAVAPVLVDLARVAVQAADEKVEVPVAVHVGERGAAVPIVARAARTSVRDARLRRPVLEQQAVALLDELIDVEDRKSTRLNSSHVKISYAVFCLKNKNPVSF